MTYGVLGSLLGVLRGSLFAVLIAWVYKAGNFDMMFETSLIWGIAPTTLHLIIAILRHYFDLPY